MDSYNLSDLEKETLLLVVTSTFGNGDSPSNGKVNFSIVSVFILPSIMSVDCQCNFSFFLLQKLKNALLTMKQLSNKFR